MPSHMCQEGQEAMTGLTLESPVAWSRFRSTYSSPSNTPNRYSRVSSVTDLDTTMYSRVRLCEVMCSMCMGPATRKLELWSGELRHLDVELQRPSTMTSRISNIYL